MEHKPFTSLKDLTKFIENNEYTNRQRLFI